jgi:4-amino-4-deoxy-L-arabinose transferase-like glycosyltransferase
MKKPTASRRHLTTRAFLLALLSLTLLGLALRLAVCLQLCPQPFVAEPAVVTDMATYRRLAMEIARGEFPSHFYYQPFYYAVFLPLVYTVLGTGAWGAALVQVALSSAAVWLTGLAAARVFGRRAGLIAAGLLALSRFQTFYVPFLLLEVLQTFWLSLLVYLVIRFWDSRSMLRVVAAGLVTGAAILTRGNAILLVPGVLALVVWRLRARPGRALAAACLYAALAYTPQLPFAVRNLHHFGRWSGPSSAQDAVLALGNSPESPPGGLEYPVSYQDWMDLANQPQPARVPVSRQVLAWIRRAPLQFVELKARMFLLYWHYVEIPNNISIDREGRYSSLLQSPWLLRFAVVGTLGVFGLLTVFRWQSPRRLFLYYGVAAHCAATLLFYVLARFRLSAVPLICVFAGAGLAHAWQQLAAHRRPRRNLRRRWLLTLLAGALSAFVVLDGFAFYQRTLEAQMARLLRPHGTLVVTHRRTRLYDHGPLALGGMVALPITPEGLVLRKRFAVPALPLAQTPPTLRVPVLLQPGTRFEARVEVGGRSYDTSAMSVEQDSGRQRLVFRLEDLAQPEGAGTVVLTLRLISGELALLVDTLRWYGRSTYAVGTAALDLQAEAALEVEWLKGPTAPASSPVPSAAQQ